MRDGAAAAGKCCFKFLLMEKIDVRELLSDPAKGKVQIREGLERDLKCAIYTLNEVLKTPVVFDMYCEAYWTRLVGFYEKQKNQVDMFIPPDATERFIQHKEKENSHG